MIILFEVLLTKVMLIKEITVGLVKCKIMSDDDDMCYCVEVASK